MKRHWCYLRYVLRHKWYVFLECLKLGIPLRGVFHDWSKFRPSEWFPYADYFYGSERPASEIPRAALASVGIWERSKEEVETAFAFAWNHHQKRNPHHWQYWIITWDHGGAECVEMPDVYRREMLADWRGAGMALGKPDTAAWYVANRENIKLHPDTRAWVEDQLGIERTQG